MQLSYLSSSPGIKGAIKSAPEDFLVEEISEDGTILELDKPFSKPDTPGRFVHFVLQKKNWSTSSALSEIADRLRMNPRYLNAAGNKDKTAITTQLASAGGITKDKLLSLAIKDIKINGAWTAADKVRMGALLGNRFTIKIQDANPSASEQVNIIFGELGGLFPNYFGEQRFGSSRKNTARIGELILRDGYEEAVKLFLCGLEGEENEQARLARKELADTNDYSRALSYFPKNLKLERSMLAHLSKRPDDYPGALKQLPRNILLLFIHAFQSQMFNQLLSERIKEKELTLEKGEYYCGETLGFPDISKAEAEGWIAGKIIGYETPLNEREETLLEKLNVSKESFRMKSMPEIASRGTYRTLLAPMKDFNFSRDSCVFRFSLPAGAYATVAMAEFMKG
ncbi:MAG: tRNA pseudouridine(13) synthase TruD [Candidatus ainarchaeum sp.]|nr:tRNA pseudouridine(13) synthase TruD [Candidatus ainarchaeum sp.]